MSAPRIQTSHGNAAALGRLIEAHHAAGGYWFAESTMAFFQSRIETGLLPGGLFISSEQRPAGYDEAEIPPREFTIRRFTAGDAFLITTVGEFQQYPTLDAALAAANDL